MKIYQSKIASCLILTIFILSCAGAKPPKPKVMLPPDKYANSKIVEGISVAIIPFDPKRSLYSDPNDPDPNKPDFNWFKAGVCPTRIILTSNSDRSFAVDPAQITCKDVNGTTYKSYDAREAGDAVVASEAFKSYVRGATAAVAIHARASCIWAISCHNLASWFRQISLVPGCWPTHQGQLSLGGK